MPYSGGGGISTGSAITGGTANTILYADASGNLASSTWLAANGAGVDTPTITFTKTMSGSSATSNYLNITGTLPSTNTADARGVQLSVTGAGSSAFVQSAMRIDYNGTFTGNATSFALLAKNSNVNGNVARLNAAIGGVAIANDSAGLVGGLFGVVQSGSGKRVALWARFADFSETGAAATLPTNSTVFLADNRNVAERIASFADNGTVKVDILDGGHMVLSNMTLTAGTMTVETDSQLRSTIHSFTWTNAQVAALGAALTGDIAVCTLPAKTVVKNAYVVITGQGAGTTTLTVSLGRTGANYIDYIVASDAQAAANTVYGDAAAERGTNLTGYDLPSYTGTTVVNCHFVATGANLDQVTGSTGRVIIETCLVP